MPLRRGLSKKNRPPGKNRAPLPDPQEHFLWEEEIQDAEPLSAADRVPPKLPPVKKTLVRMEPAKNSDDPAFSSHPLPPARRGEYAGIDANTTTRFRRGKMPIEARLDLHGMTSPRAHAALESFVLAEYGAGKRMLLVITGKGKGGEGGILRRALPEWLSTPVLRGYILAYDYATRKDGGEGAYYVLLKRKRHDQEFAR